MSIPWYGAVGLGVALFLAGMVVGFWTAAMMAANDDDEAERDRGWLP